MKRHVGIFACLFLTACYGEQMPGKLSVQENLDIKDIYQKDHTLSPGQYESTFKIGKEKVKFVIKDNLANTKIELRFRIPNNGLGPNEQGKFFFRGSDIGQPFNLEAELKTSKTYSELVKRIESCTWTTWIGTHAYTHFGTRRVEYHYVYTKRSLATNFHRPGQSNSSATFFSEQNSSDKVYDFAGTCR